MKKLKYVSADCGSGKTKYITEQANSNNKYNIIVQTTAALIHQTCSHLTDCQYILSGVNSDNTVRDFSEWLRNKPSKNLVITNKTFFRASTQDLEQLSKSNIVVHIDDVTTGYGFFNENSNHNEVIEKLLGNVDLSQEYFTSTELVNDSNDFVLSNIYKSIVESGVYDYVVMKNPRFDEKAEYKKICLLSSIDLKKYLGINITFYSNDFENSLIYKSDPELFEKVELVLNQRATPIKDRMNVFYFSKKNLSKYYKSTNEESFLKVVDYIESTVNGDYIYTANKNDIDGLLKNKFQNGSFVSVDCRGINSYQSYTNCVFLASLKPNKNESEMTEKFLGISYSDIIQQRELEALYQFVNRTALRDYDSSSKVNVYVFDEQQAYSLSDNPVFIDLGLESNKKARALETKPRAKNKTTLSDVFTSAEQTKIRRFVKTCTSTKEMLEYIDRFDWTNEQKLLASTVYTKKSLKEFRAMK